MLARENGKEGTAEMLMEWLANEDWDLREREGGCWEWESEWDREASSVGGAGLLGEYSPEMTARQAIH
jgi:hypothetical protein